jgi:DNA segregation ATPase FtsK/SpoIIIE-like protein
MTAPDYRRIAEQSVSLLLSVGCWGLHSSRQRELWQRALDLDRQIHPSLPHVLVWTKEEGVIDPPRTAAGGSFPVPAGSALPPVDERLFADAKTYAAKRVGSYINAPLVQRHVRVGFATAARLIGELADAGLITAAGKGRYTVLPETTSAGGTE